MVQKNKDKSIPKRYAAIVKIGSDGQVHFSITILEMPLRIH